MYLYGNAMNSVMGEQAGADGCAGEGCNKYEYGY